MPGITLEEWVDAGTGGVHVREGGTGSPWATKKDVLLFRGAATGPGVTPEDNQRLALALHRDLAAGIDVGITSWSRPRSSRWSAS